MFIRKSTAALLALTAIANIGVNCQAQVEELGQEEIQLLSETAQLSRYRLSQDNFNIDISRLRLANQDDGSMQQVPECLYMHLNSSATYLRSCNFQKADFVLDSKRLYDINQDFVRSQFPGLQDAVGQQLNQTDSMGQNGTQTNSTGQGENLDKYLEYYNSGRLAQNYKELFKLLEIYSVLPSELQSFLQGGQNATNGSQNASEMPLNQTEAMNQTQQQVPIEGEQDQIPVTGEQQQVPVEGEQQQQAPLEGEQQPVEGEQQQQVPLDQEQQQPVDQQQDDSLAGQTEQTLEDGAQQIADGTQDAAQTLEEGAQQVQEEVTGEGRRLQAEEQNLPMIEELQKLSDEISNKLIGEQTWPDTLEEFISMYPEQFAQRFQEAVQFLREALPDNFTGISVGYFNSAELPFMRAILGFIQEGIQIIQQNEEILVQTLGLESPDLIQRLYETVDQSEMPELFSDERAKMLWQYCFPSGEEQVELYCSAEEFLRKAYEGQDFEQALQQLSVDPMYYLWSTRNAMEYAAEEEQQQEEGQGQLPDDQQEEQQEQQEEQEEQMEEQQEEQEDQQEEEQEQMEEQQEEQQEQQDEQQEQAEEDQEEIQEQEEELADAQGESQEEVQEQEEELADAQAEADGLE